MRTLGLLGMPRVLARLWRAMLQRASSLEDPASRRWHGRLAALLFLGAAGYAVIFLPDTEPGRSRLIAETFIVLAVALAPVCVAVPWQRLPPRATVVPPVVGGLLLVVGSAWLLGNLDQYLPCLGAIFAYIALTQPPGWSLRVGVLIAAVSSLAVRFGAQEGHTPELLAAIVASSLLGELVAGPLDQVRIQRHRQEQLLASLARLLEADSSQAAADVVVQLGVRLLRADGALAMLNERAGSTVYRGWAGAGPGVDASAAEIDVTAEPSGLGTCVRLGEPLLVEDAARSPLLAQRFVELYGCGSVLYLPLPGDDCIIGVLVVWWRPGRRAADHTRDAALHLLSVQAGQVLQRLRTVDQLDLAASTDALTGVGNRRRFVEETMDLPADGAVLLFDLDGFKHANDGYGHAAGDQVLVEFAHALTGAVRGDPVMRIGGDEFAIVLRSGGADAADLALARLRKVWTHPYGVAYSAGVATPRPGEPASATLARADAGVYAMKEAHRAAAQVPPPARRRVLPRG